MARPLIDCPSCACLMDTRENACPFCGAVVRRTDGWSMLGLGFMIGLATAACGDKTGGSTGTDGSTSNSASGTDSATSTTSTGETSIGESGTPTTFGEVSAYAGPDSGDSLPDDTGNTGTSTETGNTDTGTSTGTTAESGTTFESPETSAYAGPDTSSG